MEQSNHYDHMIKKIVTQMLMQIKIYSPILFRSIRKDFKEMAISLLTKECERKYQDLSPERLQMIKRKSITFIEGGALRFLQALDKAPQLKYRRLKTDLEKIINEIPSFLEFPFAYTYLDNPNHYFYGMI